MVRNFCGDFPFKSTLQLNTLLLLKDSFKLFQKWPADSNYYFYTFKIWSVLGSLSLVLVSFSLLLQVSDLGQKVLVLLLKLLDTAEGHLSWALDLRAAAHSWTYILPYHLISTCLLHLHQQHAHLNHQQPKMWKYVSDFGIRKNVIYLSVHCNVTCSDMSASCLSDFWFSLSSAKALLLASSVSFCSRWTSYKREKKGLMST